MNVLSTSEKLVLLLGGVLTSEIIRQLWGKWKMKSTNEKKKIHDVIFFPDNQISCKDFFENIEGCNNRRCSYSHNITGLR